LCLCDPTLRNIANSGLLWVALAEEPRQKSIAVDDRKRGAVAHERIKASALRGPSLK
jgi:hypothetical protein